MTKWEYRWLYTSLGPRAWNESGFQMERLNDELGAELNQLGADGWEAVDTELAGARIVVLLKRPVG